MCSMNFIRSVSPKSAAGRRLPALVVVSVALIAILWLPAFPEERAGREKPGRAAGAGAREPEGLYGICFSPYTTHSPAVADLPDEAIEQMLKTIEPYTRRIRTFSCLGDAAFAARKAKGLGFTVAAGADLSRDAAYNRRQINGLRQLAREGVADVAVVGEETLHFSVISESQLLDYMKQVKGLGIPVTTSEPWVDLASHESVLAECDVIFSNSFPYWEKAPIEEAVATIEASYRLMLDGAGGKAVILETGWPSAGQSQGEAVASEENAARYFRAFREWAKRHEVEYYYFEAFDEPWKTAVEGPVGRHWGLWDNELRPKPWLNQLSNPLSPFISPGMNY